MFEEVFNEGKTAAKRPKSFVQPRVTARSNTTNYELFEYEREQTSTMKLSARMGRSLGCSLFCQALRESFRSKCRVLNRR